MERMNVCLYDVLLYTSGSLILSKLVYGATLPSGCNRRSNRVDNWIIIRKVQLKEAIFSRVVILDAYLNRNIKLISLIWVWPCNKTRPLFPLLAFLSFLMEVRLQTPGVQICDMITGSPPPLKCVCRCELFIWNKCLFVGLFIGHSLYIMILLMCLSSTFILKYNEK